MLCFFTGILPLRLLYWSAILETGESINCLATCVFREKNAIYNFMRFEGDVYLRNASRLESFCFDFFSRYGILGTGIVLLLAVQTTEKG